MKRLIAFSLLFSAGEALAEDASVQTQSTALQAKLLAFLTGAQPPGPSQDAIPGLTASDPPPGWFMHWQGELQDALQHHDLHLSHHPLLRAPLPVVRLPLNPKPSAEPILAEPVPVDALACPRDAPARLRVEVVDVGDDATPPWLGVDIACVDDKPRLRQQVRLLVQTTGEGRVQRAFGLLFAQPQPLPGRSEPQASPEFALFPTPLAKRFTWLVALPSGGWLAQLQMRDPMAWRTDDALPRVETVQPGDDLNPELRDAQRYTLLLADDGTPRAALLHGPVDPDGRLPLWQEGAWDAALPQRKPDDPQRTLIFQRIAKPSSPDASQVGRAWTHAGYAVWQVAPDAVAAVKLPLPSLELEGLWDCDGEVPLQTLTCVFRRLGATADASPPTLKFAVLPGRLAKFQLLSDTQ